MQPFAYLRPASLDEALQAVERVEPPPMSGEAFLALIALLRRRIGRSARLMREAA